MILTVFFAYIGKSSFDIYNVIRFIGLVVINVERYKQQVLRESSVIKWPLMLEVGQRLIY